MDYQNTNTSSSEGGAAAAEQGEVIRVLVQHCREVKRQETCSRWITALLALTIFAGFLWLQASTHFTKGDAGQKPMDDTGVVQAQSSGKSNLKSKCGQRRSIYLTSATNTEQTVSTKDDLFAVHWKPPQINSNQIWLEENETTVVVPCKGWYLLSVKMLYRVPEELCDCKFNVCFLSVSIVQENSNYPKETDVIEGQDTMRCEHGWRQSVNLNRVIHIQKSTKLRVKVANGNHKLVSWDKYSHFQVTRL